MQTQYSPTRREEQLEGAPRAFQRAASGFIPLVVSDAHVQATLAAHEETLLHPRSVWAAVPTELLSSGVHMPVNGAAPGRYFRFVARRPCFTVLLTFGFTLAALGIMMGVGGFTLSMDESLFVDASDPMVWRQEVLLAIDPDVQPDVEQRRRRLARSELMPALSEMQQLTPPLTRPQLESTATNRTSRETSMHLSVEAVVSPRRRLDHFSAGTMELDHLSCFDAHVSENDDATMELVYVARDGLTMMRSRQLQGILQKELQLRRVLEESGACFHLDSVTNYLFPEVLDAGGLRFSGRGVANDKPTTAALSCGSLLSMGDVRFVARWLAATGHGGLLSSGGSDPKFVRSVLTIRWSDWRRMYNRDESVKLLRVLNERDPHIRTYSNIIRKYWQLKSSIEAETIQHDVLLLIVAFVLILGTMCAFFMNVALGVLAVLQIIISFPLMALVVDVFFQQRPLSIFAGCALFVVSGVSADNIFVVQETWEQAHALRQDGGKASLAHRIRWTVAQSARPLLVADGTTCFSLFINCFSPIPAVFQFGLCGGGTHLRQLRHCPHLHASPPGA